MSEPKAPHHDAMFVAMAFRDAWRHHGRDVDKAGQPYMGHLMRVAAQVADDPVAVIVALLHDIQEDHGAELSPGFIWDSYGDEVSDAVDALTHQPNEPYTEYIDRVRGSSPLARRVKLADLLDNLSRVDELDDATAVRLSAKYLPAIAALVSADRPKLRPV